MNEDRVATEAVALSMAPLKTFYAIRVYGVAEHARVDAEDGCYAIVTDTLKIPWPEGLTFSEALLAWKRSEAKP